MARGFRVRHKRETARRRFAVLKWLLLVGGLLGLGWIAYAAGSELARHDVRELQERLAVLEDDLAERTEEVAALRRERDEAQAGLQDLQRRYDRDVPAEEIMGLVALLREQLDAGVGEDRLRFLIGTAGEEARCDGNPDQKRFIVQTGLTRGQNDRVAFAGNTIVVSARGEAVLTDTGLRQAWFDETKPITVTFRTIEGSESEAKGLLPLHHSVLRSGEEYRFVLTRTAERGFLQVTAERCRLPNGQ